MLSFPEFDPVAFTLGPVQASWYGLMYVIGFFGGWLLGRIRAASPGNDWSAAEIDEIVFYISLGVVLGGRVGYILFYAFPAFLHDPLLLFRFHEGGMSFHGGLLGVLFALWLFARRFNRGFWATVDFNAPFVTIGLGAGRLGNFINGELWGRVTDLPWGMVFPYAGALPRHPSQLYEFALEGPILLAILWWYSNRPRPTFAVSGLFAICYGVFRFLIEFVREPDAHLGYLAFGWLTMGQLLSLPLIATGIILMAYAYRRGEVARRRPA